MIDKFCSRNDDEVQVRFGRAKFWKFEFLIFKIDIRTGGWNRLERNWIDVVY